MSDWDTSLFDCSQDLWGCFMACFCPCVEGMYQRAAVEDRDCGILDCLWMWCCCPCCMIKVRGDIRDKYGIAGSCFCDTLLLWCIYPLPVAQQTRQLEMRGAKPAGFKLRK